LATSSPLLRYGRYGALAFEFSGTIAGGVVCGWLVDRWFGSEPYGLVGMTLLAVMGGFARLVQLVRRFERRDLERQP
jgi:F0F1-type ATP synthase assembly protein I